MKSAINLESLQQAPQAAPNHGGQASASRNENSLFNAILKNHMRVSGVDVPTDKGSNADVEQGIPASATLMNLAPAVLAQLQQQPSSMKALLAAQDGGSKAPSAGDANIDPALAMWLAA